jgi:hypothetical protein
MMEKWRKSSRSADAGQCVEVRNDLGALRDSKNPGGRALGLTVNPLVAALKAGHLDR